MQQYLDLLRRVRTEGIRKTDRTGTGTLSVFGHQMRFDLAQGFPLVTTKKLHVKSIIHELIWFLGGDTSLAYLKKHGVGIWDEWARPGERPDNLEPYKEKLELDEYLHLGPVYGRQWCSWKAFDYERFSSDVAKKKAGPTEIYLSAVNQIAEAVETIKSNPDSRRIIVSAWNPADLEYMALAPCHCLFQFYVADGKLSCQLYQRSADIFLGIPFNIASYALLTMMMAQVTGLRAGDFVHTLGDAHLYLNHLEQADLQLTREPKKLPHLRIADRGQSIFDFKYEDFELDDYYFHPHIKAPVAV